MSVAVVTPWLNHTELAPDYMRAIELGPPPDELIIADNCSDPPLDFPAIMVDGFPKVTHLMLPENRGFSGGCNAGLEQATADVVIYLNNDIAARREGWLRDLVEACVPGVLVGANLVNPEHAMVDGMSLPYLDGWCIGGMREDLLELGGWDESLQEPSYYGDNLLCLEARAQGFLLREVSTGLVHKRGQTTRANGFMLPATKHNRAIYEARVRELVYAEV